MSWYLSVFLETKTPIMKLQPLSSDTDSLSGQLPFIFLRYDAGTGAVWGHWKSSNVYGFKTSKAIKSFKYRYCNRMDIAGIVLKYVSAWRVVLDVSVWVRMSGRCVTITVGFGCKCVELINSRFVNKWSQCQMFEVVWVILWRHLPLKVTVALLLLHNSSGSCFLNISVY